MNVSVGYIVGALACFFVVLLLDHPFNGPVLNFIETLLVPLGVGLLVRAFTGTPIALSIGLVTLVVVLIILYQTRPHTRY